jgi:hypothetical protein
MKRLIDHLPWIRQPIAEYPVVRCLTGDGCDPIEIADGAVFEQAIEARLLLGRHIAVGGGRPNLVKLCPIFARLSGVWEPVGDIRQNSVARERPDVGRDRVQPPKLLLRPIGKLRHRHRLQPTVECARLMWWKRGSGDWHCA